MHSIVVETQMGINNVTKLLFIIKFLDKNIY